MAQPDRPHWQPWMADTLPESPIPSQLRVQAPANPGPLHPAQAMDFVERFFTETQRRGILAGVKVDITKDQRGMTIRVEMP